MSKRLLWLDILKVIACFLVLTNHTVGYLLEYEGINFQTSLVYCIAFSICKVGVPIFIMVSGYLLLKDENISSYHNIINKIFRIFVPLFILSIIISIRVEGIANFSIIKFLKNFLTNPIIPPYWYLYMLIGLYIVTPFIQKMVKTFTIKDYRFATIFFVIIPSLFPMINRLFKLKISNYFSIAIFPISIGYFIAGLYLSKIKICRKNLIIAISSYIFFTLLLVLLMFIPYLNNAKISYLFDSWYYVTTAIPAMTLFYIIRYFFENIKQQKFIIKIIEQVSLVTFGIYLFHYLINYRLYSFPVIQNIFGFNPYLGIFILEISNFILCGLITFILRKIPMVNRFL